MGKDEERRTRSWEQWAVIGGTVLAILLAGSGSLKTWFLNDYRIEQTEKTVKDIDDRLRGIEERLAKLETTYHFLVDQAIQHGWTAPPTWVDPKATP